MVSSDFGKLDVIRHLSSGIDCAIAGLAMSTAAAPAPSAVRNLRRFIRPLPSTVYGDWQKRPPPHGATMRPGPFERKPPKRKLATHQTIGDYRAALLTSACRPPTRPVLKPRSRSSARCALPLRHCLLYTSDAADE